MNLRFYSFVVAALAAAGCTGKTSQKTQLSGSERGLDTYLAPVADEASGTTAKLRAESGEVIFVMYERNLLRTVKGQKYKRRMTNGATMSVYADCELRDRGGLQAHLWTVSRVKDSEGPWTVGQDRQIIDLLPVEENPKLPSGSSEPFCLFATEGLERQILIAYEGMTDGALEVRQKVAIKKGSADVADGTPGVWLVDPISKSHDFEMDLLAAERAGKENRAASRSKASTAK